MKLLIAALVVLSWTPLVEGIQKLAISGVEGSTHYLDYVVSHVTDGDYAEGSNGGSFCTKAGGMYFMLDLGEFYEVDHVDIWGRDETTTFYLNQMQNLKITVSKYESYIDDEASLCVYRDGAPSAGENRPETFSCTSTMVGRYVKVSMVDASSDEFFCLTEAEVYGVEYTGRAEIAPVSVTGSEHYLDYEVSYLIDGNYAEGSNAKTFCTKNDTRYALIDLGDNYEVLGVVIWGRDESTTFYLDQMQNLKITVSTSESDLDSDSSLCMYRNGAPSAGENRPEELDCTSTMIGRYVKVSMVDVSSDQFMCLAEIEVYGTGNGPTTGGCPSTSACKKACKKKYFALVQKGVCRSNGTRCYCKFQPFGGKYL